MLKEEAHTDQHSALSFYHYVVKCRKIIEGTPGTPDIKSGPMRCQKGLWLQLMCCTPFRLLSQDFRMRRMEDRRLEDWSEGQSCSQSRTLEDGNQGENLFNIQTEVPTWQVQGIYTK